MKRLFIIISLSFLFNITDLNSYSDKELIYDRLNYNEKNYKLYFINSNSYDLEKLLKQFDIKITGYYIDDKKYYARSIDDLIDMYTSDMNLYEKIIYKTNGIKIDGISVVCNTYELDRLKDIINIY